MRSGPEIGVERVNQPSSGFAEIQERPERATHQSFAGFGAGVEHVLEDVIFVEEDDLVRLDDLTDLDRPPRFLVALTDALDARSGARDADEEAGRSGGRRRERFAQLAAQ